MQKSIIYRKPMGEDLFEEEFTIEALSQMGNPIERLAALVDFEMFRPALEEVWQFVNKFADFNRFTLNTIANNKGRLFNLPFNMHTFYQMWGVTDIEKAKAIIESQRMESGITDPDNLEEKAISLVGKDVYEMLIKGYTEKQWGKPCNELPYCLDGDAAPVTIRADKPSDVYVVDGADLNEHYRQSQEAERMGRDYMAYRLEQVKSRIIARYQQKGGIGVADI